MNLVRRKLRVPHRVRHAVLVALWFALLAMPASASRITQVRVGNHPTFSRVVFQMDAHTGYRIERRVADDGTELLAITLDASSRPRNVASKSVSVESVSVSAVPEEPGKVVAVIRLRKSDLLLKEMILSNPPRIVLDFEHGGAVAAKPAAAPKPAPVVEPEPVPAPAPAVVVKPPMPEPVVAEVKPVEPPTEPIVVAKPEPEPAPAVEPEPEIAATPSREQQRAALRAVVPGVHKRGPMGGLSMQTGPKPGSRESELLAGMRAAAESTGTEPDTAADPDTLETPAKAMNTEVARDGGTPDSLPDVTDVTDVTVVTDVTDDPPRAAQPRDEQPRRVAKTEPAAEADSLNLDPMTLGAIGAGVVLVALVAMRLVRRRSIPAGLDVASLAEDLTEETDDDEPVAESSTDAELADRIPTEGFAMNEDDSDPDLPTPQVVEQNTAAYSLSEVSENTAQPDTGLFDEDSEEKDMDLEATDLPADRTEGRAELTTPPPVVGAGADTDVSQLVQELASRLANLEGRLDEANDARERLERQVAAQSEELRVQRAAIARTQRALRSLSRSEEDQATEPAIRNPSS